MRSSYWSSSLSTVKGVLTWGVMISAVDSGYYWGINCRSINAIRGGVVKTEEEAKSKASSWFKEAKEDTKTLSPLNPKGKKLRVSGFKEGTGEPIPVKEGASDGAVFLWSILAGEDFEIKSGMGTSRSEVIVQLNKALKELEKELDAFI